MGLSMTHLLILLVIVLIFFGPNRLPNLGKSLGEAIRGFKKGLDGEPQQQNNTQQQATTQQLPAQAQSVRETHEERG